MTLNPSSIFGMLSTVRNRFLRTEASRCLRYFSEQECNLPVAVVLTGCGGLDGSEIHEAASVLSQITRWNATPFVFAPVVKQEEVNHISGQPSSRSRDVDIESARIARKAVKPLEELVDDFKYFGAVVFPGGKGVANILSDFATKGRNCTVRPDVVSIIRGCHAKGIPLGFACLAPVLAARILCNPLITLGNTTPEPSWPYSAAIDEARAMGASLELKNVNEITKDNANKVYSTPCFMNKYAKYHEVDDAIGLMIQSILSAVRHGK